MLKNRSRLNLLKRMKKLKSCLFLIQGYLARKVQHFRYDYYLVNEHSIIMVFGDGFDIVAAEIHVKHMENLASSSFLLWN